MRRSIALFAAGLVAASSIAAGQQQAPSDPMHDVELAVGDSATVEGDPSRAGTSLTNVPASDTNYGCEGTPEAQCEVVLVKVTNPYEAENAKKGRERANLTIELDFGTYSALGVSLTDMAIKVFASSADGERGEVIGNADNNPPEAPETMTIVVSSTEEETEFWYRVELIYGAHAGGYTADFSFTQ
jgi:hypothetical protein